MKKVLSFLALIAMFFINSCKDKGKVVETGPNIRSGSVRIISTNPNLAVGLIQRLPKLGCDIIAYGPKDVNGYLTDVERTIIYEPKSEDWMETKYDNGAPVFIETKKGIQVILESYNFSTQTVNAKVIEKSTGKILNQRNGITFSNELRDNILMYRKTRGFRLGAISSESPLCDPNTRKALDMVSVVANAAVCGTFIGVTISSGGAAGLFFGLEGILACYGLFDGFVEIVAETSVIEYYFGENVSCGVDGANAGMSLSADCWNPTRIASVGSILKCSISILDAGNKGAGCGCEEKEKKKTGRSAADPHLQTTDGLYYDFQSYGEFIALKSTTDNFEIQVRQEGNVNVPYFTVNTAVGIQTGGDVISVHNSPFGIYLNGTKLGTPMTKVQLKNNAYIEPFLGSSIVFNIVTSNNDLVRVRTGAVIDFDVFLNTNRMGKVEGLLGNFDGNKGNDLKIRNGSQIDPEWDNLYPKYADSWRAKENFLFYYQPGKNTQSHTNADFPKRRSEPDPEALEKARTTCVNSGVTQEPFLSNCIFDVSLVNDPSFVASALNAQNNSNFVVNTNEISEFNNVVLTASRTQGTLSDSCLLDYTNGKVYSLKDGAKYADKVDAILSYYCGLTLDSPAHVDFCNGSCGIPIVNSIIKGQKWSEFRTGAADFKLGPDNPFSDLNVAASQWPNITTSADLGNLRWQGAQNVTSVNYQFGSRIAFVSKNSPLGLCNPDDYYKFTLYRFITKEGRKGVFRIKDMVISANGYKVIIDIKIQK